MPFSGYRNGVSIVSGMLCHLTCNNQLFVAPYGESVNQSRISVLIHPEGNSCRYSRIRRLPSAIHSLEILPVLLALRGGQRPCRAPAAYPAGIIMSMQRGLSARVDAGLQMVPDLEFQTMPFIVLPILVKHPVPVEQDAGLARMRLLRELASAFEFLQDLNALDGSDGLVSVGRIVADSRFSRAASGRADRVSSVGLSLARRCRPRSAIQRWGLRFPCLAAGIPTAAVAAR